MFRHAILGLMFLLFALLASCAAPYGENVPYLLEQNYHSMSNQQLIAYEQELSDEILQSTRSPGGDVSLGVGFGSWGSHAGVGVGLGQRLDRRSRLERDLWARRREVREEMRQRGILEGY